MALFTLNYLITIVFLFSNVVLYFMTYFWYLHLGTVMSSLPFYIGINSYRHTYRSEEVVKVVRIDPGILVARPITL